ncbi:hypothetical protein I4U23_015629 [Adineta vaga]|nr:hypothetical protein I4U23_015629 [Adineta vaga]
MDTYAGCGTLTDPTTTVCDFQRCANACYDAIPACGISTTWGQCRRTPCSNGNGLKMSFTTLTIAFVIIIYHKCF